MAIPLQISPRIIPSIASLYNDPNRIFMEYIDNAIDSAEELFDSKSKSYIRPIVIEVKLIGSNLKDGQVKIKDNCFGITNFVKVVKSIGDSDKKGQFTTNGQFGYGIYSFMAAGEKLEIISKLKNKDALYLPIKKSQFNTSKQEDVSFPEPKKVSFSGESGTEISLSQFEKTAWKQIDVDFLKVEIEKHFEIILNRGNLEIRIIDQTGSVLKCDSFNYDELEGEVYEEKIKNLSTTTGRRYQKKFTVDLEKPITVFLKLTTGRIIDKNPVFIIKGRRIAEVKEIKPFRSNHKSDIWGHPNLTGFIDLGSSLQPTIARTDFQNTPESKAIFEQLMALEPLILEFIKDVNKQSDEKHYKELEDVLNSALSRLAKIDSMNFRTEILEGNTINLQGGGQGADQNAIMKGEKYWGDGTAGKDSISKNPLIDPDIEGDLDGNAKEKQGKNPTDFGGIEALNKEMENPFEDSEFKGSEKKKSGFNIRISEIDPDIDAETDQPLRSKLAGNDLIIYKKHPDFESRVIKRRNGDTVITQRLITYLSGEITVHYKDKFFCKGGQPEYNINLFKSVVDFIYKFEDSLKVLVDKNLSEIA